MIVYDKEQKEIVIPNGIGNINLFNNGVEAGYNQGKIDGIDEQKSKLESINITENGTYNKEDGYNHIEVNVPDLNGSYDEGYAEGERVGYEQGKTDGVNEQKSKLESINITENGTYSREDGYNHIEVNVPDLNGSYDEGYEQGKTEGEQEGYKQGQTDMAANARVLNVTENGVYKSKFSDPIIPANYTVTGVYADGTNFYSYAELNGKVFNTKIAATIDNRLEFWYKGDNTSTGFGNNVIIGAGNNDDNNCFQVRYYVGFNGEIKISVGNSTIDIDNWNDTVWHHLIISKAEGLWVDGEKKGDFTASNTVNGEFYINGIGYDTARNANGTFGMIKIDDVVIIPTAEGFKNVNTGKLLEAVKDGAYTFTENLPIYAEGELYKTINVNVPDLNGSYDEGYAQGKIDGIDEQKSKLETINITENGTYANENGYSEVVVDVPDLNGSYSDGYKQGQANIAANARVLNVTENGVYKSKFSDPIVPDTYTVTGVYDNGTNFYSYAELNGKIFNTKIAGSVDSRLEFWYKGDNTSAGSGSNFIIGAGDNLNNVFEIKYYITSNNILIISIGNSSISVSNWDDTVWHHLIISKAEGLWIDGEKKRDFSPTNTVNGEFFINGIGYNKDGSRSANGTFGMIKIDNTTIIPTADGFLNTNTGELLEVVKAGGYNFTENLPTYPEGEGELYKTINVNIDVDSYYNNGYNQGKTDGVNEQKSKLESISITENGVYTKEDGYNHIEVNVNAVPKINVAKAGLKFGSTTSKEVPEWADFEGITDMSYMFYSCDGLQTMPMVDTSNVTNMRSMFEYCYNLQTIPQLDTSNVTSMYLMFSNCQKLQVIPMMDTSNAKDMRNMFSSCIKIQTIPMIDTSNATMMSNMFSSCSSLVSMPSLNVRSLNMDSYNGFFGYADLSYLTDFGGFLNLKSSLESNNNLKRLPNLTYESCINVLNGLYDFTGNGEVPNSNQGKLKVHQNFLDKVGEEISIGVAKGWTITA